MLGLFLEPYNNMSFRELNRYMVPNSDPKRYGQYLMRKGKNNRNRKASKKKK